MFKTKRGTFKYGDKVLTSDGFIGIIHRIDFGNKAVRIIDAHFDQHYASFDDVIKYTITSEALYGKRDA